jgi:hypothetical protein
VIIRVSSGVLSWQERGRVQNVIMELMRWHDPSEHSVSLPLTQTHVHTYRDARTYTQTFFSSLHVDVSVWLQTNSVLCYYYIMITLRVSLKRDRNG